MGPANFRGYLIARSFEHQPPHYGDDHAQKNDCCRIVRRRLVKMTGLSRETRHYKVIRNPDNQDTKSTQRKQNESCKDQNVQDAGSFVPRVLPLPQPVLENIFQA
jgi:hypothetical protein